MTNDTSESEDEITEATLEAVLFMHGAPVTYKRLEELLSTSRSELQTLVESLRTSYAQRSAGLSVSDHNDAVQIVTTPQQSHVIEKLTKRELEGDLSQASLEVLAVIAYRGPLSKPDVESIRGVNCSYSLRNLLLRGLVEKIPHPTDSRTRLYRVTHKFVRSLGIDGVESLPEFDELVNDKRIDKILFGYDESVNDAQSDEEREDADDADDEDNQSNQSNQSNEKN